MKLQELYEAAVKGKAIKYDPKKTKEAIDILNTHCKNALWMLHENKPIWRGAKTNKAAPFLVVDTSQSERKSENTKNYYTVIFDNNPAMAGFPKRSQSLIGTTEKTRSYDFTGFGSYLYAMIPFDDAKIGAVNSFDIWDATVSFGDFEQELNYMNKKFEQAGIPDTIEGLKAFAKKLKDPKFEVPSGMKYISQEERNDFMAYLYREYSPKNLGFTLHTTSNMKGVEGEVWVGGKVMMIEEPMWQRIRKAYDAGVQDDE
jgi:hypothetical protein